MQNRAHYLHKIPQGPHRQLTTHLDQSFHRLTPYRSLAFPLLPVLPATAAQSALIHSTMVIPQQSAQRLGPQAPRPAPKCLVKLALGAVRCHHFGSRVSLGPHGATFRWHYLDHVSPLCAGAHQAAHLLTMLDRWRLGLAIRQFHHHLLYH